MVLCWAASAAERRIDFSQSKVGAPPAGFRGAVTGEGKPGEWKVVTDEVPSLMPALSSKASAVARQSVLAQLAQDPTDEHFPLFVYEDETFGDFTLTTRLKTVAGKQEQMAGVAFRIQNETNYYVVRISSMGNNIRFYKFVNGVRSTPIGPELKVPTNVWHELTIECKGNQIRVLMNGIEVLPTLTDSSFPSGKIGFWTKSDSISYFADAKVTYTVRQKLSETLVADALSKYGKLLGLKLYTLQPGKDQPQVIASNNKSEVGQLGGKDELDCLHNGTPYVGKGRGTVAVLLPVRDRNGEAVAVARITMDTFFGQTENNALTRARPVVKFMESRILGSHEAFE